MAFRFFQIPVRDSDAAEAELNVFLRAHRVLSVDRRWIDQGENSFWSLCVDYLESGPGSTGIAKGSTGKSKVDYKEVLSAGDFAVFAQLREIRKEIAQTEAVPVYTVFTNQQLAQMVQDRAQTKSQLEEETNSALSTF